MEKQNISCDINNDIENDTEFLSVKARLLKTMLENLGDYAAVAKASEYLKISKSKIYKDIKTKDLKVLKKYGRTLISTHSLLDIFGF